MAPKLTITPHISYDMDYQSDERIMRAYKTSYGEVSEFLDELAREGIEAVVELRSDPEDYKPAELTVAEARAKFE